MPKKIFEMANEVGMGALDLVEKLKTLGFNIRNHMSTLSDEEVEKALSSLKVKKASAPVTKKTVKKVAKKVDSKMSETSSAPAMASTMVKEREIASPRVEGPMMKGAVSFEEGATEGQKKSSSSKKIVTVRRKSVIRRKAHDSSLHERDFEYEGEEIQGAENFKEGEGTSFDSPEVGYEQKSSEVSYEEFEEEAENEVAASPEGLQKSADDYPELRGLQIVSRPEPMTAKPSPEEPQLGGVKAAAHSHHHHKAEKPKEYLNEKMHSFTPIYTPPAEKAQQPASTSSTATAAKKPGAPGTWEEENADKDKAVLDDGKADKKRMAGLAAIMAKPKAKVRDVVQLRADEELKSYGMGILGKAIYTPPGKKKIYSGPSKGTRITQMKESKRVLQFHRGCTTQELAQKLSMKFEELRDKSLDLNLLIRPEDYLGIKLLKEVANLFNFRIEDSAFDEGKALDSIKLNGNNVDSEPLRSPVVTVMGHVDHGKTTLLDTIRRTKVVAGEAGGITQHIGAYKVPVGDKTITFFDTPGHAAFSSMRERGANITDIVILVVAADDGVMPQTKESILLCKNSGVPIIVAINKMDKESANPDRIKQELMKFEMTPEEWGGETMFVGISALKGEGVDKLLESILLQAEIMELKANEKGPAEGVIIESRLEAGRGPIVTALIQSGILEQGDAFIAGEFFGRARSLLDAAGNSLKKAGPSTPIQILGLNGTPNPGDKINGVKSEREAKKIVENRVNNRKELSSSSAAKKKISLEDFFSTQAVEGEKKFLKLVVRADVLGSYEAIKSALQGMGNQEVGVEVIAGGAGAITDSDVQLASSAEGHILGFNMRPVTSALKLAEDKGVDIKTYRIIYELIQDVKLALEGMLIPDRVEKYIGRAEVRNTFSIPKIGTIAGSAVIDGKIERGCNIRLLRDGKIIFDGKLSSLKRFKDDVKEVKTGYECGISLESFNGIQLNDIFEAYIFEEKKRTLEGSMHL